MWLRKEFPYPQYRWQRETFDGETAMRSICLKVKRKPNAYYHTSKYYYFTFFRKRKNAGEVECAYKQRNHVINLAYPNALKNLKRVVKHYADEIILSVKRER